MAHRFQRLGVVGAGVMGSGIAAHWRDAGYDVVLVDTAEEALSKVSDMETSTELEAVSGCDLVLEAVYEDPEVKGSVLRAVPNVSILATNTSSLTVAALAVGIAEPSTFLALHYNNPPATNPIVEVVPGRETSPALVEDCIAFVRATGKRPIVCRDEAGFALNRQSLPYLNEAGRLVDEGLGAPSQIDDVAKRAIGVGLGPFEVMNLIGTRVVASAVRNLAHHGPLYTPSVSIQERGATNAPWELDESCHAEHAAVEERLLGAIFVASLEIVNGGIATAEDLDFICTTALGYPKGSIAMMAERPSTELRRIVHATCERVGMPTPRLEV